METARVELASEPFCIQDVYENSSISVGSTDDNGAKIRAAVFGFCRPCPRTEHEPSFSMTLAIHQRSISGRMAYVAEPLGSRLRRKLVRDRQF